MNPKSLWSMQTNRWSWCLPGRIFMLAALALLAATGGCQSTAHVAGDAPVITLAAAENSNLNIRWKAQIGLAESIHERVRSILRSRDMVFVITNRNHLVALNAAAGTTVWTSDFGENALPIYPPVEIKYGERAALAVFDRLYLYVVDRRDGKIIDRTSLSFVASSPGVAYGNILCIGSEHDFFYGLYIDVLGKTAWSVRAEADSFVAPPALTSEGNVTFCSRQGMVWKVSAETGQAGWNRQTTGEVVGPLTVDTRAVYIPCLDRKLYAFELGSSKRLWDARLDGKLDQAPVVAGVSVLAVGSGSGLYAVDIAKGDVRWFVPNVKQILTHTPDHVFVADSAGKILAISLDTGVADTTTLTNADVFASNTTDATLYIASRDGRIAAVETVK